LNLTGEEHQRLTRRHAEDNEAYLLYREGIYHLNTFRLERIDTAKDYFERALKKDPNYASALLGIGRCYILSGSLHLGPRKTHSAGKNYLRQALAIDDTLADARAECKLRFGDLYWA
jgi:tetratricopeptide (TPR) repeat protein